MGRLRRGSCGGWAGPEGWGAALGHTEPDGQQVGGGQEQWKQERSMLRRGGLVRAIALVGPYRAVGAVGRGGAFGPESRVGRKGASGLVGPSGRKGMLALGGPLRAGGGAGHGESMLKRRGARAAERGSVDERPGEGGPVDGVAGGGPVGGFAWAVLWAGRLSDAEGRSAVAVLVVEGAGTCAGGTAVRRARGWGGCACG